MTNVITSPNDDNTQTTPETIIGYEFGCELYLGCGYGDPLPLPPGAKYYPPSGYTGNINRGIRPTPDKYEEWLKEFPDGETCIRLAPDIAALDIDTHDAKNGIETIRNLERTLGPLPRGPLSCKRDNPIEHGKRLVQVPPYRAWKNPGPDVEIRHHGLSYILAYPSYIPENDDDPKSPMLQELWWYPNEDDEGYHVEYRVPLREEIPVLPDAWVRYLDQGELEDLGTPATRDEVTTWLASLQPGEMCERVATAISRIDFAHSGHDTMLKAQISLLRLGREGHTGIVQALEIVRGRFLDQVSDRRRNGRTTASREWHSALQDAQSMEAVKAVTKYRCWCGDGVHDGFRVDLSPKAPAVEVSNEEPSDPAYDAMVKSLVARYRAEQEAKALLALERLEGFEDQSVSEALAEILDGDEDQSPTVGELDDEDKGLFYAGQINGLFGKGGTGKTLYIADIQVKELNAGNYVIHFEFDNNPTKRIVRRLVQAGADHDAIAKRFIVLRSRADMERVITPEIIKATSLVTLDALTPAIGSLGGDVNQPSGTDMVFATYLSPFTIHGACAIYIDHVGHENQDRQSGSKRKFDATQGALYEIKSTKVPSIGTVGLAELILRKDNQGSGGEANKTAAYITYRSTMGGKLTVTATRKRDANTLNQLAEDEWSQVKKDNEARYDYIDSKVVDALEAMGKAANAAEVYDYLKPAIAGLVSERAIKLSMQRLLDRGRLGKDELASKTTAKGGKPSDRYRPLTPSWE